MDLDRQIYFTASIILTVLLCLTQCESTTTTTTTSTSATTITSTTIKTLFNTVQRTSNKEVDWKQKDGRYLLQPNVPIFHPSLPLSYFRYPSLISRTPALFLADRYVTPTSTTTLSQGTDRRQRDVLASQGEELPIHVESTKIKSSNVTIEGSDVSSLSLSAREEGGIDITEDVEGRSRKVQGCCWKVKVAFTTGQINGSYKLHQYIFGFYTMEPGLINGRNHYRSVHNNGAFAISFCGDSWWIQAKENTGECKGWAHSGWTTDDCVHDIEYTWRYYIPIIDEFVTANKGLSTWCKS